MRYNLKRIVNSIRYHFHHRAQEIMFALACSYLGKWRMLSRLAPKCGVRAFTVSGRYGEIRASSTDEVIVPEYVETGVWAEDTNLIIREFFGDGGGTYLDIGANIGLTTIPIARNPLVKCIAFEPEPATFANLSVNIAANCPAGNVEIIQSAVFDRRTTLTFEISVWNSGDHRIRFSDAKGKQEESSRATIPVEAVPLDEVVGEVKGRLAAKIDTQGAEPFVFAGGAKTLAKADLIIVEWSPYLMARLKAAPEIVVDFLRAHFETVSIVRFGDKRQPTPQPIATAADTLLDMARLSRDDPYTYCDVIARR